MLNPQIPVSSIPTNAQISLDPRFMTVPQGSAVRAPLTNISTNPIPYGAGVVHPGLLAPGMPPAGFVNNQTSRNVIVSQQIPGAIGVGQTTRTVTQQVGGLGAGSVGGAVVSKPSSSSRIEYVPYQKKVVEYETRQILTSMWVPVQRKCLNYYAIQNITQFLPKEIDDIRYEMVPEEQINYRLQYVPIQKKIVHLPKSEQQYYNRMNLYDVNINTARNVPYAQTRLVPDLATLGYGSAGAYNQYSQTRVPGFTQLENRMGFTPRTNYVTTDGYVPSFMRPDPIPTPPPSLKPSAGSNVLHNTDLIAGIKNSLSGQPTGNNILNNADLLQGIKNSMTNQQSGGNILSNPDLAQGIRNSVAGGGSNLNAQSGSGPSFLSDNNLLAGIANSIRKTTTQNYDGGVGSGDLRRSDSYNYRDSTTSKPRDTGMTENDFEKYWG